jgi:hypothetical protein
VLQLTSRIRALGSANLRVAAALAVALVAACSGPRSSGDDPGTDDGGPAVGCDCVRGDTGVIAMHIAIVADTNLYSVNYRCDGPSTIPPGTVNLDDAKAVEIELGALAPGTGNACTFWGTDHAGDSCTGTTTPDFSVIAGQVTSAWVLVTCNPTDASIVADASDGSAGSDGPVVCDPSGASCAPETADSAAR